MRKLFAAVLLFAVLAMTAWTSAQGEAAKPQMDRIVYLSADYHDSPQEVRDAWAAEFKRITGVQIVLKTVSSKDAGDAMMAQFMAGEFPDVVKFGGENLSALARQEFVVPLSGYIEKSGMKKLRDMFPSAFQAHAVGDELYGIPEVVGAKRALWVRTDVLDKLGIAMPKTLDQLVASLKKIRDQYPTPDGGKMYPYISKTYHSDYISGLSNYFDVSVDPVIRRPKDKQFREGWDSPQFKDYAALAKMFYDEKLMDPDHVLPQKASATRSKFYAGKGAYLMMHAHLYQELVSDLRKSFPGAELTIVPPIVNPKGGVLGMSVSPGYRPFCIMTASSDPQFVWDKVIETVYLNTDGVMLLSRGIPSVSYRIEGGTLVDNFDRSGEHMGLRSPLNPDIVFPYKLAALNQRGVDLETEFDRQFAKHGDYLVAANPSAVVPEFDMIREDMGDKKQELFWKYVLGEHTFEQMMAKFDAYKKEVGFSEILKKINAAQ